jgi:hypothetical protein
MSLKCPFAQSNLQIHWQSYQNIHNILKRNRKMNPNTNETQKTSNGQSNLEQKIPKLEAS